ncbi:beta strand repeat-containing protein [Homoserinimonas aerilata]|uniref:beta strand repeat-containing protein n=1 Tax=Homoserinimonas aerilata TaxID=1162970 RepID=UPI00163A67E5|nr:right-handed parallel beta-helix repeat-containing protein [Homoserinimonas aerilata]
MFLRLAALGAALAVVASALVAAPASASPGVTVTAADLASTGRTGSAGWWADYDSSMSGSLSVGTGGPGGAPALGLHIADTSSKAYVYNNYPAGARPTDVAPLRSGASYTYAGTNVNFQIEMVFKPVDPAYGPNPDDASSPGETYCDSANRWGFTDVPADWCYTSIKWEPLNTSVGSWTTVDLAADTAVDSGTGTGGWRTNKRIGIWGKAGSFSGSGTFSQYLDQIESYQVTAFVIGTGSGTAGPVTGWVRDVTFGGTVYSFATSPAAPTIGTASLSDGRNFTASWSAPTSDGGSAVTGYQVNLYDSAGDVLVDSATVDAATTSHIFTGDPSGTLYATVQAVNAVGTSAASAASGTVVVPPRAITVGAGGYTTIAAALTAIAPGGVVTIPAGVYVESLSIRKPVTLQGEPGTIIQQRASGGANKIIDIYGVTDVTLSTLTVRADAGNATAATGIDINSAQRVTLDHVTAEGHKKNGVALTGDWSAVDSAATTQDVTLQNVTASGNGWAGIALYTRNNAGTLDAAMTGVQFAGTTTVTGNRVGIQFGDNADEPAVTGTSGDFVSVGTVVFGSNSWNLFAMTMSDIKIDRASTIEGRQVVAADFEGAVDVVPLISTTTTVNLSSSSVVRRSSANLVATVSPAAAGTVTFRRGGVELGTSAVAAGQASLSATFADAPGDYSVTATFAPTEPGDYAGSVSDASTLTVTAPTAITVGSGGYTTLADALAEIAAGGTITLPAGAVATGTTVTVSVPNVTLKGAKAGVAAATGPRSSAASSGESVLAAIVRVTSAGVTFDGLEFANAGGQNVQLMGTSSSVKILNSRFTAGTHGISEYIGASGATVHGNLFAGVTRGIVLDRSAIDTATTGMAVTGNTFRGVLNGVSSAATKTTVTGNSFSEFTGRALGIYGSDAVISGNTFAVASAAEAGIRLVASSTHDARGAVITGNVFSGAGDAILIDADADARQGMSGASSATGNSFTGTGISVRNLATPAFAATGNWWNDKAGSAGKTAGAVNTTGYLTPKIASASVTSNDVANTVTSVATSYQLVNPAGVTVTVTGANALAIGNNTVRFVATLTIAGASYSDTFELGVRRSGPPPVVIPPVVPPVTPPVIQPTPAPTPTPTPTPPVTPSPVLPVVEAVVPPVTVDTPPPAQTTEQTVLTEIGATTVDLLERYAAANGGATPPPAAQVFTFAAGSEPESDGAFLNDKAFTASVPWSDASGDQWVDVWAYSSPVFIGTFPVIDGVLQITGADLSALGAGDHHLVMVGQTSGTDQVAAISVATPTESAVPPAAAAEGNAVTTAPEGDSSQLMPGWLLWSLIALVLAIAIGLTVFASTRRRA